MKTNQELIGERDNYRSNETSLRWLGGILLAVAGGVSVGLSAQLARNGLNFDTEEVLELAVDVVALVMGAQTLAASISQGGRADTIDAELLRRDAQQPAAPPVTPGP